MSWSRSLPVTNAEVSFEQPDYHNPTPQKNGPKKQGKVSFQRSFPMVKGTVLHCMHETGATIFPWGKIELANLPRGFVGGLPVVHKAQIRLLIQSDVTYFGKKSIEAGASIHQHGDITYVGCLKPSSVILSSRCDGITKVLTTNSSKSQLSESVTVDQQTSKQAPQRWHDSVCRSPKPVLPVFEVWLIGFTILLLVLLSFSFNPIFC